MRDPKISDEQWRAAKPRIVAEMQRRNLTNAALAARCGYTTRTVSEALRPGNGRSPGRGLCVDLCLAVGLTGIADALYRPLGYAFCTLAERERLMLGAGETALALGLRRLLHGVVRLAAEAARLEPALAEEMRLALDDTRDGREGGA